IGNEFAAVQILLDGQTLAGPPRHVIAQQFTGRDVGDAEVRGDQCALSPLARARRRDHQYPHPYLLTSSSLPSAGRSTPRLTARAARPGDLAASPPHLGGYACRGLQRGPRMADYLIAALTARRLRASLSTPAKLA